ncbi:MAG: zinc ribbon domain-containing protein [Clostridia bacterium]|nr:zinc ribbon domain-containing protein [Clostridia bacterium]
MYCKHCGSQINADSRFCSNCGGEQGATIVYAQPLQNEQSIQYSNYASLEIRNYYSSAKSCVATSIIGLCCLVYLFIGIFFAIVDIIRIPILLSRHFEDFNTKYEQDLYQMARKRLRKSLVRTIITLAIGVIAFVVLLAIA